VLNLIFAQSLTGFNKTRHGEKIPQECRSL